METKYKIEIPKPCHQNWDKMTTNSSGKFCNSCTKSVIDFTKMNAEQIQNYFVANKDKRICGRFKTDQLNNVIIRIPEHIVIAESNFNRLFLLALLITMGTTLLSCSDIKGDKQKIDKVEITKRDSLQTPIFIGESSHVTDSLPQVPPPPPPPPAPKIDEVKFTK